MIENYEYFFEESIMMFGGLKRNVVGNIVEEEKKEGSDQDEYFDF